MPYNYDEHTVQILKTMSSNKKKKNYVYKSLKN